MNFFCMINFFRLAANEKLYISSIMHIRDVRDKRRLIIKSIDVILFGPPQRKYFDLIRIRSRIGEPSSLCGNKH